MASCTGATYKRNKAYFLTAVEVKYETKRESEKI